MSSRFFTNSGTNALLAKFQGIFEHHPDIERFDAFYHLPAAGELIELSFVEAARIFQANAMEKPCPLHDLHHEHVGAALDRFKSDLIADAVRGDVVDHQIGPIE